MAYDEDLADRVRATLAGAPDVTERKMFGGLAFLVRGHMVCGIVRDDLMLRLGEEGADAALDQEHVRPMDFTGRPLHSMVFVASAGLETDGELERWVAEAVRFVATLPPKPGHEPSGGPCSVHAGR